MTAYYNENDPKMVGWLRELIVDGVIADGIVDDRSIIEIKPDELAGYTQCHFFAGAGVWSYSLRRAGWPDDYPIWTGSCPCQPFSPAGEQRGVNDERHLWPAFYELIKQTKPCVVLGEQVGGSDVIGKIGQPYEGENSTAWIDAVLLDLEAAHYTSGAIDTPSAGVGSPQGRERVWWMAYTSGQRCEGIGRQRQARAAEHSKNGYWDNPNWVWCADGDRSKWRPFEPASFPLAHGSTDKLVRSSETVSRKTRLKGYGNAINAESARVFVECAIDILSEAA